MVNSLVVGIGVTSFVVSGTAQHPCAVGENSVDVRIDAIIRLLLSGFKVLPGAPEIVAHGNQPDGIEMARSFVDPWMRLTINPSDQHHQEVH